MTRDLEALSKAELIRELEERERRATGTNPADREHLIHDLEVHQIELEMQNRELREASERLAEASDRYRELYDFAPVGYCTLDPEGHVADVNLTCAALLGARRDELTGRSFAALLPRESRPAFSAHIARCRQERQRVTSELALKRGARGPSIVQIVSEPMWDDADNAIAFRTSLVDISTLKELEQDLALLSRAGETLTSSMDRAGTLEAVAQVTVPRLADICMIDLLEDGGIVERPLVVFADPDKAALAERFRSISGRAGWLSPQSRVITSGEPMLLAEVSAQVRNRIAYDDHDSAALRAADIRSMMIVPLAAHGRVLGALTLAAAESCRHYTASDLVLSREVASRVALALDNVRLYAEAKRATAARDATLAVVAHDMRSPVQTILIGASMLASSLEAPERRAESQRFLGSVQRSAERMSRLIRDLVDVSSIEAGRFSVTTSPQSVKLLVDETIDALRPSAAAKSVRLVNELGDGDGFEIDADRDRIEQVLENLLGNATKFTPHGGTIIVRAAQRDGDVCISIADSGPGLAASQLPHVFDRYWQAPETARLGHGLGLAIAKGIVDAHKGRIWVESELGIGTTFYVALPLAGNACARSTARAPSVLVVDDDPVLRDVLSDQLARAGYEVARVADGAQALAYLDRVRPSLILLDLAMPVMDGWQFLAERDQNPALRSIPVLVISAHRDVADRVAALHANYMAKPITGDRLLDEIAHAASSASQQI